MIEPRLHIYPDERAAARALAQHVADAIAAKPDLVLGLPTGRTAIALYDALVTLHRGGLVSFAGVTTFNLDEFVGLLPDHPGSYRQFMETHLFGRVNLPAGGINFLRGDAEDAEAESARYERSIADAGGLDLQVLGLGGNGHIGFNEPASSLQARTHKVTLEAQTRRSNAALFGGDPANVPADALSMGMATILQARAIVLVATGSSKAPCVAQMLRGPITTSLPASFLQLHPAVDIVVDEAAASGLLVG